MYALDHWSSNVANPNSAATTITMNAPHSVTAFFTAAKVQVTVGANPAGRSFSVGGVNYTTMQTLSVRGSGNPSRKGRPPALPGRQ